MSLLDTVPDNGSTRDAAGSTDVAVDPKASRAELGAFLRSRRERLTPADVDIAPGLRRRTPGLRREEVAQLAGVSVTWYTWLEQGRPINVSVQVLDAVARTLRLDSAERAHVYRLAGVPALAEPADDSHLEPEIPTILDALDPLPAAVYNGRYDLLAWNQTYAKLFPRIVKAPTDERNVIWQLFMAPRCCCPFVNRDSELEMMVARLRGNFGRHVGEPVWTDFIRRLSEASIDFDRMWAGHDVAEPGPRLKLFSHPSFGEMRLMVTSLALSAGPETRLHVYSPVDDESRRAVERLLAQPEAWRCDHDG